MSIFHKIFDKFYPIIRFVYERIYGQHWYDPILPNLWLGGAPSYARDYEFLLAQGIGAVVDIRAEREDDLALFKQHGINHLKLKVADVAAPPPEIIDAGVRFIKEQIEDGRKVYVHCAKGRGRSATLVAGYLMRHKGMSFDEARTFMRGKRPLVKLEARHNAALNAWLAAEG